MEARAAAAAAAATSLAMTHQDADDLNMHDVSSRAQPGRWHH